MVGQVTPGLFQTLLYHTVQFTCHWSSQDLSGYAPLLLNSIPSDEHTHTHTQQFFSAATAAVLFIGDVIVARHVLYTYNLNITTTVQYNTKYCTMHTFTIQVNVCFASSTRAFIQWNRQNSEAKQCPCVDIAIQFNSRCSTPFPRILLNAQWQLTVATIEVKDTHIVKPSRCTSVSNFRGTLA